MITSAIKEELLKFARLERPFEILQIETSGKSITALYKELDELAQQEFWEHCFRSKKNYCFSNFRTTSFYTRYAFLRRHLGLLTEWLYGQKEDFPEELSKAMTQLPCYDNPWGLRESPRSMKQRNLFKD